MIKKAFVIMICLFLGLSGMQVLVGGEVVEQKDEIDGIIEDDFGGSEERVFTTGNGTLNDPYMIYDVHDLQDMNENLSAHYALANDIDANETEGWNDGAGFEPVGNDTVEFTGSLDGRNHTITGLYINNSEKNYVGLFGVVGEEVVIKNTGLVNTNITADRNVGGLVGENYGTVENSYATGNTTGKGDYYVGGLIASNRGAVENSYATGNTTGKEADSVGGLIGRNRPAFENLDPTGGMVKNSYATGDVSGNRRVGGLVGNNGMATIEDSYAAGKVSGDDYVGGLVGQNIGGSPDGMIYYSGHIYNSTTSADVRGDERVGGLVGRNREYCTIYNSSATGDVLGTFEDIGGLVGQNDGSVSNSHAHGDVSGNKYVGGLVGQNSGPFDDMVGSIDNSSAAGNVSGESHVGGLVGRNGDIDFFEEGVPGFIENSYATGTSEGKESIGGLVGFNVNGTVSRSYATGNVDGEDYVGGLAGINNGTVSDSYAAGKTLGTTAVGGLVGYNWDGAVENTYAVGNVSGTNEVGGLVGDNLGTVSNSFYDLNTTGQDDTGKGEPKTTEEMMTENTFTEAGWDFDEIWHIHDGAGYPIHLWDLGLSYVITDVEELNMIRFDLAGDYTIANDIDASETEGWNDGKGFEPLGIWDDGFTGTLDGNGHNITGLYINRTETNDVGLFGFIEEGAVVRNVGLVNSNVTGQWPVGGLVGTNSGTVDNSYVKGTTFGQEGVGGLVGYNWEGTVKNSYALGNTAGIGGAGGPSPLSRPWDNTLSDLGSERIMSGGNGIGGLVGVNEHGSVKNSHAMGNTTGAVAIGGLVGVNELGLGLSLIENSYAIGNTSGVEYVGGLVGENIDTIASSSAFGYTRGEQGVGGLVGYNSYDGIISDSYSEGNTTEGEIWGIGGLAGVNEGLVKDSYATGDVNGGDITGGLVGDNWYGTVENSYATGKITGNWGVGGLIGYNMAGNGIESHADEDGELGGPLGGITVSVSTSYAIGDTTGSNSVGGLVGYNDGSTIENSYSRGDITRKHGSEETDLGGFVGFNDQGKIMNCYSTGQVIYDGEDDPTEKGFAGNVITDGDYEMSGNFWDNETSEQTDTAGNATGKSTEDMMTKSTFTDAGWDFTDIWDIVELETYPTLIGGPVYNVDTDTYFPMIQEAIDDEYTLDGHTIKVTGGTYDENVVIHKSIDLIGAGPEDTYIDAQGEDFAVLMMANDTTLSGFTLKNAITDDPGAGLLMANLESEDNRNENSNGPPPTLPLENCTIEDMIFANNNIGLVLLDVGESTVMDSTFLDNEEDGMFLMRSDNNSIVDNNVSDNVDIGILLMESPYNTIVNNTLSNNGEMGIGSVGSKNNDVYGNNVSSNDGWGIVLVESYNSYLYQNDVYSNGFSGIGILASAQNTLYNNTVSFSTAGIFLNDSFENSIENNVVLKGSFGISLNNSNHNSIESNTITDHVHHGIDLSNSSYNYIDHNHIYDNNAGISLDESSDGNIIVGNTVSDHTQNGIQIFDSDDNHIFHNVFINNSNHAWDEGDNIWDDGYPSGGNYWDDHTEPDEYSGPDQDKTGSDGIVDDPREIDGDSNVDNYPWTNPEFTLLIDISEPLPEDGSVDVPLNTTLSVYLEAEEYPTEVEFYLDGGLVYSETLYSEGIVETDELLDLEYETEYEWYVDAANEGGANRTLSPTYTFTTKPQEAHSFDMSVDDITAGEHPFIDIYDGEDIYGKPLEGNFTAEIELEGESATVDLFFIDGSANHTWDAISAAGDYTAYVEIDDVTRSDDFVVNVDDPDHISIVPSESIIVVGEMQAYNATAYDQYGNEIGDVTSDTDWSIEEGAGGTWDENIYTSENAGEWIVSGTYEGLIGNATLIVETDFYTLTTDIEGEGDVEISPDEEEYANGTIVTLTAVPAEDWFFVEWSGDHEGTDEEITIIMDENKSITANFEIYKYTLTINEVGDGSVDVVPDQTEYEHGTKVNLTAIPDEGWFFVEWSGDYTGTDEEITIIMDENKTITANFEIYKYTLTIDEIGDGSVDVVPDQTEYEHGTKVNLTAIPDEGWFFVEWSGDYTGTDEEITIIMDENKSITANFDEIKDYILTIDILGEGSTDPAEGAHTYDEGEEVTITTTSAEGWYFVNWTGDYTGTDEEITIIMDENKTITANFEIYKYTLTINEVGDGSVDVVPDQTEYEHGTKVNLTAIPDEGWFFVDWSGDYTGTDEEITIIMDENMGIKAHFEKGEAVFEVEITDYDEVVEEGEEVTVEYRVQNTGNIEGEQDIVFVIDDNETIVKEALELGAGEEWTGKFNWTPEKAGEYEIGVLGDEPENFIRVDVQEAAPDEDVGFLGNYLWLVLLLLMAVGAVMVFMILAEGGKKEPIDEEETSEDEPDEDEPDEDEPDEDYVEKSDEEL